MNTHTHSNSTQQGSYKARTICAELVSALRHHSFAVSDHADVTEKLLKVVSNYALATK